MTTIRIENIEETVHEWAGQYFLADCNERPHNLAEYFYTDHVRHRIKIDPDMTHGEVSVEAVVTAVQEALNEIQDDPESAGAFVPPIMYSDIFPVWEAYPGDVDEALHNLGGFSGIGITSIDQAISMGVHYFLEGLVREAATELEDNIDDLVEALEA